MDIDISDMPDLASVSGSDDESTPCVFVASTAETHDTRLRYSLGPGGSGKGAWNCIGGFVARVVEQYMSDMTIHNLPQPE
jgi:hypothetical protein